jgi:hypothetical protein
MKKFIKFIATAVVFALITALAIGCSPATGESKDKEISFKEFAEQKYQLIKNVIPMDYDSVYDFELHYKMTNDNHSSALEQVPSEDGESENIIVVNYYVSALYESNLSVKRKDGDMFITLLMTQKHKHVEPFYLDPTITCENSDETVEFYQTGKDEIGYYIMKEEVQKYTNPMSYTYTGYNEYRRFDSQEDYKDYVMSILGYDNFYTFDNVYLSDVSGTFTQSKDGVTMNMEQYEGGLSASSSSEGLKVYNATYTQNGVYTKSKNVSKSEEFRDKTFTKDLIEIEIDMEYSSSYSPKSIDFVRYEQAYVDVDVSDIIYMNHDI